MRRTKIICTIGPRTASFEKLKKLAEGGMNIARLNLSHGDHEWHRKIIRSIQTLNEKGKYSIALMLDTKGAEVRSGDLSKEMHLNPGDSFTFTIRRRAEYPPRTTEVSYDGFVSDVKKDDVILIDGGVLSFKVLRKTKTDVYCECIHGGVLTSRRHINIRGKSSTGPTITKGDWDDIAFGIEEGVDFIALSFVKDADSIRALKSRLGQQGADVAVIAKIESFESLKHLPEIIDSSDGVMVARGDLGAEIPIEDIPMVQEQIIELCHSRNKPVIVATHLLESMIVNPTPTRAEVTDITQAIRQGADAVMLSGETASGNYPYESLNVLKTVTLRAEKHQMHDNLELSCSVDAVRKNIAASAVHLSNTLKAQALLIFTRHGHTAALIAQCRPVSPVYAFTNTSTVRRQLNLYWGVTPAKIELSKDPEQTVLRALSYLTDHSILKKGDTVVLVSNILVESRYVETIQVRTV